MKKIDKKWLFDKAKKTEMVPSFWVFHPQEGSPGMISYAFLSEPSRIPRPKIPIGTKLSNFELMS